MQDVDLGIKLSNQRKAIKKSRQEIADELHVNISTVRRWELGQPFKASILLDVAKAYRIDVESLVKMMVKD